MKKKPVNTLFFSVTAAVLLLLTLLIPDRQQRIEQSRRLTGSLTDPAAVRSITAISLSTVRNKLEFRYATGQRQWLLLKDGQQWAIKTGFCENFLNALTKKTDIYPVSNSAGSWQSCGVDEENSVAVVLRDEADRIVEELFFGYSDPGGRSIYFRSAKSLRVLRTTAPISSFLTAEESFWTDLRPYHSISGEIIKLVYRNGSVSQLFGSAGRPVPENFLPVLRQLQGLSIVPRPQAEEQALLLDFETGDTSSYTLAITAQGSDFVASDIQNDRHMLISAWAFKRLMETLGM